MRIEQNNIKNMQQYEPMALLNVLFCDVKGCCEGDIC